MGDFKIPDELKAIIDAHAADVVPKRRYLCGVCEDQGLVWVRHQSDCGYSYFGAMRCTCGATFPKGPNGRMEFACGYSEKIPTYTASGLTEKDVFSESARAAWEEQEWLHADRMRQPDAVEERKAIQGENS